MAYKFSKGSRGIGDIVFEDDVDTGIDFEDDVVALQTNGNNILKVSGSNVYLADGSHLYLGGGGAVFFDGDDPSIDVFAIEQGTNNLKLDGNNSIILVGDERVIIQENTNVKANFDFNNNKFDLQMPLHIEDTDPTITFKESGTEKATIGVNSSDNILIENKTVNKHIVFKVNDQGVVREGLRLDGAVPEVVVNQTSDSLVDFRVESDNQTHMLFVDGSQDMIGIKTDTPLVTFDVNGEVRNNGGVYRKLRDVNSTGNILQTDYVIRCVQTNAITLTLPSKSNNQGQIIILKDALGNANSNNITVQAATGDTIDGSSSYVISNNKEGVTLMCDGINGWMILSRVRS